jgi:hypothetical protein
MTRSAKLLALAERVKKATGSDRELDGLIWKALFPVTCAFARMGGLSPGANPPPDFTSSLDAAMTLVPEGWHVMEMGEGPDITPRPQNFEYGGTAYVNLHYTNRGLLHNVAYGTAVNLPLALTAASLRAIAAKEGG